ncbi:MAG: outer membrane protein assembly factor BamD, partial [Verrucomicrobia bacterium]|nr:outer membrane protein assembly factor BamD [Verrucomicrobiota bacterium]
MAALAASTAPAHAVSAKERRAFAAAAGEFQAGLWNRADAELARFLEKFPNSTNASQAVLMQAQAEFHQAQFSNAIVLLQRNLPAAGPLADQFVYWIGEARFAAGDYPSAEKTFASLVQQFPNSPLQARAIVEQAAALADQNRWRGVIALLAPTNGLFQAAARANPDGDTVSRGRFYLAQAFFSQRDFSRELSTLDSINSKLLPPPLDWKRQYMLYQLRLSTGDLLAALSASTNLLRIAALQQDVALVARTRALRGGLFEQMGRTNDALAEYQQNLTNAPVGEERQAIFKIAALSAAQGQFTNAEGQFRQFLLQFSNAPAADVALLTLGELRLKSWDANPAATNDLLAAQARFGQLISGFTNSLLLGQAFLDRGWTFWFQDDYSNSAADFGSATRLLQPSDDLAVAKFKLADSLFAQNDFSGAWGNYRAVLRDFTNFPAVQDALAQRALYQSLQASLRLHDFSAAADALSQLLLRFPSGEMTSSGRLLYGESQAQAGYPLRSRRTFEQFEAQYPNSPLLPRAAFAAARTYELQNDWSNAVAGYQQWLKRFPASPLRPRVAFALARANSESGNETRAAALFAGFTTRYPTNALAAQAFWWLGDHFFNLGGTNYVDAEENYEFVYQNFPDGPLAWPARWMAGRAATARQDYAGAIRNYF